MAALRSRSWGFVLRVLMLCGASGVCGLLANTFLPMRIPWTYPWSHDIELRATAEKIPLVALAEARDIVDEGLYLVLDARSGAEFRKGHLPGAFSVPQEDAAKALGDVGMLLTKNQPVLVYCAESDCDEGLLLCLLLRQQGYVKATLFLDGYRGWAAAGLPVEKGS